MFGPAWMRWGLALPLLTLNLFVLRQSQRQQRLLQEAARFADTDMGQMAKQITEIRSLLAQADALPNQDPVQHNFTPREASVLQLVAEGLMNKEIARQLETSIRNVEKYVSRLFIKTETSSRTELVRYALRVD